VAIVTNTITRYDGYRAIREDLANVIYNISPVDVPFMSNIGRENVKNTYYEWQTDTLAAASTTNAQLEGDDLQGVADSRTPTARVGNYTQISRKVIEVSNTLEAVDKAGMRSYLAYQLAKAASELKRDMCATLTSNNVAVVGNSTTARKTAGMGAWLITNSYSGASGAAPVMSSGSGNFDGYPATAATAGTSRVFTETLLKNAIQGVWTQGGDPKVLMTGPFNKATVSGFSGIATRFRDVPAGAQAEIVGAADVYVSDFGTVNVVPNRFQPEYNAYLLDPEYASVAYLRNFRTEVLGLVKRDKEIQSGNTRKLVDLVENRVLPHFDFTRMTRIAMAVNWRRATPEQQKALVEQFRIQRQRAHQGAPMGPHAAGAARLGTRARDDAHVRHRRAGLRRRRRPGRGPTVRHSRGAEGVARDDGGLISRRVSSGRAPS